MVDTRHKTDFNNSGRELKRTLASPLTVLLLYPISVVYKITKSKDY
jgi:hypothetical protein